MWVVCSFMCYSACFVRRKNIKFITYLVMCSQSLTVSKEIVQMTICHSLSQVFFQQTIKNIWRAILKYQGILNANNKVISKTAPAQKARSIIISSETSSASFDVSIFSSFSKCDSVTKTTVHYFTFFYPTRQKLDPRRS